MSDTPKTEEVLIECIGQGMNIAPLADWARQLERELNEARAQNAKLVSDIYAHEHINTQMIFEKRKLERELKEATKDKKRLDWLDENAGDIEWYGRRGFIATSLDDVRAAIDAARKEQG